MRRAYFTKKERRAFFRFLNRVIPIETIDAFASRKLMENGEAPTAANVCCYCLGIFGVIEAIQAFSNQKN